MHKLNTGKGVYIGDLVNMILAKELIDAGCVSLSPTSASTPLLPQKKKGLQNGCKYFLRDN